MQYQDRAGRLDPSPGSTLTHYPSHLSLHESFPNFHAKLPHVHLTGGNGELVHPSLS